MKLVLPGPGHVTCSRAVTIKIKKCRSKLVYHIVLIEIGVGNGSERLVRVRVRVETDPLPTWQSRLSMHPNTQCAYCSMEFS